MEFNTNEVEDTVLLKSDGFPTYHGAVVIDDDHMGVTHAMRGEEWISSIPTQVLTARALGVTLPRYAHMPNIMGSDGKKLSKRTGDTATELYLERGYLPEAILNFVAFLGWNPKTTQEIFSLTELEEAFSFEGMNRSGPMLDIVKLDWMNAQYISRLETADLCTRLTIYLETYLPDFYRDTFSRASSELNYRIIHELKTRLKRLDEYPSLTQFFYGEPDLRQDLLINPKMKVESLEDARTGLEFARSFLQNISGEVTDFDAFKAEFLAQIAGAGYKNGFVLWPVRIALSGAEFSPGAFEIVSILGKEVSIQRITRMLEKLED